jgi:nicotinamidase-related amidase
MMAGEKRMDMPKNVPEGLPPDLQAAFARGSAAHIVVDIQRRYCDMAHRSNRGHNEDIKTALTRLTDSVAAFTGATRKTLPPVWVAHVLPGTITSEENAGGGLAALRRAGARVGRLLRGEWRTIDDVARAEIFGQPVAAEDLVIGKRWFDAFDETKLDGLLRARGVDTLVISGVFADCCVAMTALGAAEAGYNAYILDDLTLAGDGRTGREHGEPFAPGLQNVSSAAVRAALG